METNTFDALNIEESDIRLPYFYPSISSIKTNLNLLEYIDVLTALETINKRYLFSAYDTNQLSDSNIEAVCEKINQALGNGVTVLMDSGNYESFWKSDNSWKSGNFHNIAKNSGFSAAFCFDEQAPPADIEKHLNLLIESLQQDKKVTKKPIIPIIHGAENDLPYICKQFVQMTNSDFIALPERRLGDGIFGRALNLRKIRSELDKLGCFTGIHLLGTGNPMSLAIYSVEGANSYDGLEWCQTVVDHDTGFLYHSTQFDFFRCQTQWGEENVPYTLRMLAHNLEFYSRWMEDLRRAILKKQGIKFCELNFHPKIFNMCCDALGWEK